MGGGGDSGNPGAAQLTVLRGCAQIFSVEAVIKMNGLVILLASDNENPASHKATLTHPHTRTQTRY